MKFSTQLLTGLAGAMISAPVAAEEALTRYAHKGDGQYELSGGGQDAVDRRHSGFLQSSAAYVDIPDAGADGLGWSLRGSHNSSFGSPLNVQIDGTYETVEIDNFTSDNLIGALHFYYRDPQSFAAGVFVQGSRNTTDLDARSEGILTGLEAAVFTDNITILGQAGVGHTYFPVGSSEMLHVKGEARFYVTDSVRFDAEASYNMTEVAGFDLNTTEAAITANYRPDGKSASLFAGYRYENASLEVPTLAATDLDSHSFILGARFHYGSASLKDEERNGALWSPPVANFE